VTPSPEALRAHRRVLLPLVGALFTAAQLRRTTGEIDRQTVAQAARWQGLGAAVVLMHAVLQIGVEGVRWLHGIGPGLGTLDPLVDPVLLACTVLNVGSGVAEYGFIAVFGLRAAAGAELPFLTSRKRTVAPSPRPRDG